jgi:hypothetical protein
MRLNCDDSRDSQGAIPVFNQFADTGTPYVIFEVIAALKVSNSLSVQQWTLSPAACAGVFPFNVPCFRHGL